MKKSVLFIVENNSVPEDIRVWNEALAMKEFGFRVSVICPKRKSSSRAAEELQGIHIYRHPRPLEAGSKYAFFVEYANALFWEFVLSAFVFARRGFRVIHAANPPDHVYLIAVFYKLFGVKYVFDHHDASPENYVAKFGRKDFIHKVLLHMERASFKTADAVISTNESYRKIAIGRGGKREESVFVVRNGPNLRNIVQAVPNPVRKDGFRYLVVYVGTIGTQEGIDHLLNAVAHLVHRRGRRDIKFTIVGSGTHLESLRELSRTLGLERFVEFTGFVPYEDFYEIIASADLCVNPEHRNDFTDISTMIKIMDYMVFGKPIVQFETTEGRFTAGESALYVPENRDEDFAEAIAAMLDDDERRARMGREARRRVDEQLSWDHQKVNLKRVYDYLDRCGALCQPGHRT